MYTKALGKGLKICQHIFFTMIIYDPVELEMIFFLFANLNTITITLGTIITCHILLSTDDVPSGPGLSV